MPNHCYQELHIYGNEDSIKDLITFSQEGENPLSANRYIPYPQSFKDLDKKAEESRNNGVHIKDGFNSGGYEWCVKNWGTKWGIYSAALCKERYNGKKSKAAYAFDSAWSPAIPVIMAMSVRYPDLRFKLRYYERGQGYKGIYEVKAGQVLKNESSSYSGNRGG